ncbi:hypothetical protein [Rhodococcoides kyotonense]|uniref:Uncharacterized protein n=1 Tax=Rhodococcoides kyotonense TaxID=398843 RepID=A0A239FPS3_9NOCA|nr:hypothetical protein [Rhodococcus kyotonensis]SNS57914.1 hypothetical protein SAMN05421642_103365 [Rhodococcus kyotonensis]
MRHTDYDLAGEPVFTWYSATAEELYEFCLPVIEQLTSPGGVAAHVWLIHEDGHTEVKRSGDFDAESGADWPLVLMTGPDLDWVIQWFLGDLSAVGPEREQALADAFERARMASKEDWIDVFQRACDEQLNPLLRQVFPQFGIPMGVLDADA